MRLKSLLRLAFCVLVLAACTPPAGQALPGSAAPVVKLGLIAPFEGLGRPLGYALLPAVKIALEDANAAGELGPYRVALVALNDDLDPETSARQVQALAADSSLLGALGPWTSATAAAAAPAFARAGLPALVGAPLAGAASPVVFSLCPSFSAIAGRLAQKAGELGPGRAVTAGPPGELQRALAALVPAAGDSAEAEPARYILYSGDAASTAQELARLPAPAGGSVLLGGPDLAQPWLAGLRGVAVEGSWALACSAAPGEDAAGVPANFAERYQALAGAPPGPQAVQAYRATRRLVAALAEDIRAHGQPGRAGVAGALGRETGRPDLIWLQMQSGNFVTR